MKYFFVLLLLLVQPLGVFAEEKNRLVDDAANIPYAGDGFRLDE